MRKFLFLVVAFFLIQLTGSSLIFAEGNNAPDFSLKNIEGKVIKLSDFKGKVVILDFWATWCPPCRRGIPDLIQLQKDYSGKVQVIGISVDQETKNKVPDFVKSYGMNYPVLYSNEAVIKEFGGLDGIPTAFIIDQSGKIVDKFVGLVPKENFTAKIDPLLKNPVKSPAKSKK